MITIKNLNSRKQTVEEIKRLSTKYISDILPVKDLSILKFFDFLKSLRYHQDVYPVEILRRPGEILKIKEADCKKKTILALSYAKINNIPNRILTISTRKNRIIHHIFPQFLIGGKWVNYDATYPNYKIAQTKFITNIIIYPGV